MVCHLSPCRVARALFVLLTKKQHTPKIKQHTQADQLDCALDLMRRLPPQSVEENLAGLLDIVPHLTEDLLSAVDQPLKVCVSFFFFFFPQRRLCS